MYDSFNREINYLRISVTDRCNLRCRYCMPPEGIALLDHRDILSYDEIMEVVHAGVGLGINKVRVTGGEPLVRRGLASLIRMIAGVEGISDLSMTTNGQLLELYAGELKEAGLQRVNISLDTLDPDHYRELTRGGNLDDTLRGIRAAIQAGLHPVKLNCVIRQSASEPDAAQVGAFALEHGLEVRFIHRMDLETGYFRPVEGGEGGHCHICNRLRLTSNGLVKPCLFSDIGYSVRELGANEALKRAIFNKPHCGDFSTNHQFYNIGG